MLQFVINRSDALVSVQDDNEVFLTSADDEEDSFNAQPTSLSKAQFNAYYYLHSVTVRPPPPTTTHSKMADRPCALCQSSVWSWPTFGTATILWTRRP